jgi:hypothetical protein
VIHPLIAANSMSSIPESQKVEKVYSTKLNSNFASQAEVLTPELHQQDAAACGVVQFVRDDTAYFKLRRVSCFSIAELSTKSWGKDEEFILDFGSHYVGYFKAHVGAEGVNIDAPARLRLTFGEVPLDVTEELHPCKSWISSSWLPDEVVNVDWLPTDMAIPRRHAFRYVRVQILDTSPKYKVIFTDIQVHAISSAPFSSPIEKLPDSDALLQKIDAISMQTLRSCMQTVFEDGPRRDRRMWIGDLRLQALANYQMFKNYDLVKRCLYMFAALPHEDGSLPACVFEKPTLSAATDYIVDYDVLFGSIVLDYCRASGDMETGKELWSTVLGSTRSALEHVGHDYAFDSGASTKWKFLDWAEDLDRDAGMHGLLIFALKNINDLARLLSQPVPFIDQVSHMLEVAKNKFFDEELGVFVSGPTRQISWASQAWMALAGAVNAEKCKGAITKTMANPEAIKPRTPYLFHYVAEALSLVGGEQECLQLIRKYWGGMVEAGADTFWEFFDPDDCRSSPYGDCHNHSYCHAWSSTPSYLLRVRLRDWLKEHPASEDILGHAEA